MESFETAETRQTNREVGTQSVESHEDSLAARESVALSIFPGGSASLALAHR